VRAHVRTTKQQADGQEKATWFFTPKGPVEPFIIGDCHDAKIFVFESQFDMLAVLDRLGWHNAIPSDTAAIATRGASNTRLLSGRCHNEAIVYAFTQNDTAGQSWLSGVAAQCGCKCLHVVTPQPHKDVNDWTRAGATADELQRAIAAAKLVTTVSDSPALDAAVISSYVALPTEDDEDALPPPFPVDALPPALSGIINAVARSERVPVALPAVCALGVASASLGAGLEVISGVNRVTRGNLFLLADAESGSGKSESCRHIIAPMIEHQTALLDTWREKTYPDNQAEIARLEAQRKAIEKKIAKAMRPENPDEMELQNLQAQLAYPIARTKELRERAAPCIIADDVTIEALALRLRDNREVIFCFSSDARKPVQNLMGRYNPGKTTDESLFLKAYSGEFSRVDRAKGDPVILRNPCLTLCWFVQPDLLATMLDEDSLSASGFLPRILVCRTQATMRRIEGDALGISDSVRAQWAQLVAQLLATFLSAANPFRIEATTEAKRLIDEFHNAIVDRCQFDLADVRSYAARYAEQAWRLAVVLHAALYRADAGSHSIDPDTARNAICITEWFIAQQLDILAKGRHEAAEKIETQVLELIEVNRERKHHDYIRAREVERKRIVPTSEAARTLLARMESEVLLVGEDVQPKHGGKKTRIYRATAHRNPVPE